MTTQPDPMAQALSELVTDARAHDPLPDIDPDLEARTDYLWATIVASRAWAQPELDIHEPSPEIEP